MAQRVGQESIDLLADPGNIVHVQTVVDGEAREGMGKEPSKEKLGLGNWTSNPECRCYPSVMAVRPEGT